MKLVTNTIKLSETSNDRHNDYISGSRDILQNMGIIYLYMKYYSHLYHILTGHQQVENMSEVAHKIYKILND